jgi:hypothetical protein
MNDADVYFVANTSNHMVESTATFSSARRYVSTWDPLAGGAYLAGSKSVVLSLAPYESRVIVFSDAPIGKPEEARTSSTRVVADLTHGWKMKFGGLPGERDMQTLASWTDDPKTRFYSGVAVYAKTIRLGAGELSKGSSLAFDFGEGTPVVVDPKIKSGMRALLEGPIREAAVVTVNGQRVGSVWHPPYTLDVTKELHAGENTIEVRVANTAINVLAGRAPADYRLLNLRYGERFTPQDMDNLQPLPSGLLGTIQLVETK